MNSSLIFWPVLAQILLTLTMLILLGVRKTKAVKAGEVNRQQAALGIHEYVLDLYTHHRLTLLTCSRHKKKFCV